MIKRINESKTLINQISCICRWELDGEKCNSRGKWNNDKRYSECKKQIRYACEEYYA